MSYVEDHASEESRNGTRTAVALALNSPVAWSMTPHQIAILKQLCALQFADAGVHALLPNVMAEFVALARRPWWDAGVAGVLDEPLAGDGDVCRNDHL